MVASMPLAQTDQRYPQALPSLARLVEQLGLAPHFAGEAT